MKVQSYYRLQGSQSDVRVDDAWLVVNCSGAVCFRTPFRTDLRRGRRDFYLLYLLDGSLTLRDASGSHELRRGNFYVYPPETPFFYEKTDCSEMVYLWAHFSGAGALSLLESCNIPTGTLCDAGESSADMVSQRFQRLYDAFLFGGGARDVDAAGCLMSVFASLQRSVESAGSGGAFSSDRLRRSLQYIASHFTENITVSELAKLENLSEGRYNALFKQKIGSTPREYIIELRLRGAEEFLRRTDLSVKEVASLVGYEDQNYFSRLYAAKRGYPAKMNRTK